MGHFPYFIWNGKDSREMGIWVSAYPPVSRPKERVQSVTIPGRSGSLTLTEGKDIYEPVLMTCKCVLLPDADIEAVLKWLRGSGEVVFGCEPDFIHEARIINQVDFARLYKAGHREFSVPFQCQPLKRRLYSESAIRVVNSTYEGAPEEDPNYPVETWVEDSFRRWQITFNNPGDVIAHPLIHYKRRTDTGTEPTQYTLAFLVTGFTELFIVMCTTETEVVIDCEAGEVLDANGSILRNTRYGEYPYLGLSKDSRFLVTSDYPMYDCVITPNWRWL